MPDIQTYVKTLKLKWIKSLTDTSDANWKILPKLYLNQYSKKLLIFKMNIDYFKSLPTPKLHLPLFYKELVESFIDLNNCKTKQNSSSFFDIRTNYMGEPPDKTQKKVSCL